MSKDFIHKRIEDTRHSVSLSNYNIMLDSLQCVQVYVDCHSCEQFNARKITCRLQNNHEIPTAMLSLGCGKGEKLVPF